MSIFPLAQVVESGDDLWHFAVGMESGVERGYVGVAACIGPCILVPESPTQTLGEGSVSTYLAGVGIFLMMWRVGVWAL